jgi:predicted TIM-barrel fold metal-dependent hydrolase
VTIIEVSERTVGTQMTPVRVVDSDIHPTARPGALLEHFPEPFKSKYLLSHPIGDTIFYDAPDYANARAMRVDAFPEDGTFPGSDPELAYRQAIMEAGSDIGILEPSTKVFSNPAASQAAAIAVNGWLDEVWLSGPGNWHQRWRGSICAAIEDPAGAVREIERWAGHPFMSQILIKAEPRPAWGDPQYYPIWETATKHDIPVSCHLSRGSYENLPIPPVGLPSYNHDFMVSYSLTAANQVMSLIFDGVFDAFPTLRIVLVEHAFSWILPLMWRMDKIFAARGSETGLKRRPSEYVKEHIRFTTQPLDYPEDKIELTRALEWMEAEKILLFSSDYPHWTYDDPRWLVKHLPESSRERIMFRNGIETYHLPTHVPALPGQTRPF